MTGFTAQNPITTLRWPARPVSEDAAEDRNPRPTAIVSAALSVCQPRPTAVPPGLAEAGDYRVSRTLGIYGHDPLDTPGLEGSGRLGSENLDRGPDDRDHEIGAAGVHRLGDRTAAVGG